ncbi:MAG TPA: imidazoleglycerol-phosphate dehydratase HisB [Victivallales bacterium]|nr:imidazoleglycerol-phosphate dehydratase HisB [Victivallales bacterium]
MKKNQNRIAEVSRKTKETDIYIRINIDGNGKADIDTGIPFLDHMLELFSKHGDFDLSVKARGDISVDYHHTIEDVGIVLGDAIKNALKDKRGIKRYGFFVLPMDEALVLTSIDISGRSYLKYDVKIPSENINGISTRLFHEFIYAVSMNAGITLHIKMLYGEESHHIVEAIFKSFAKSLHIATMKNYHSDDLPSTKGLL